MVGASNGHEDGWRVFKGVGMDSIVGVGGGVDGGVSTCVDYSLGGVAPRSGGETAPAPDLAWAWVSALV